VFLKASLRMKLRWSMVRERERLCGRAGDYSWSLWAGRSPCSRPTCCSRLSRWL